MIVPGKISARECMGCGAFLVGTTATTMVVIVRAGVETVMLVTLCTGCTNARLADMRCVNMGRADALALFQHFAAHSQFDVNGGGL